MEPTQNFDLKVTPTQHMEECRIIYEVEVNICNNGIGTSCFEELTSLSEGIEVLNIENSPLNIDPGNCDNFILTFEVHEPLVEFAKFKIYDACNKCYKEFTVDINVEILDCEEEITIENIDYYPDISSEHVSYFKFSLLLPSNPQAIFRVWTEPYQVIDHIYNPSSSIIDGLAMFDNGVLTQMSENGEEVCFHVLMCKDNIIHECVVCIKASELLEMIGYKSIPTKPNENDKQPSQTDKLYLVLNPASTSVKVEGIEQDNISELLLIDMTGKNLKKVQATNTLDIQDILKGTYILRVINKENKVYYLKLIKN